ncbi:MAG: efflux RND transporter periplasmic adaptor subunit [Sulfurimonas sp.]|jgi:RND family efflux transporter MFP subunit|nr:efflux RND transporter periplasmic adaptor subunit [Sulfurimonas sp.]
MSKIVKYITILIIVAVAGFIFYNKVYVVKTTYKTLSPKVGDLDIKVFGIGNVDARDIYSINAQTGGKIVSIFSDEGLWVKQGDLLVVIDPVEMPEAIQEMQIGVKKAKSELNALTKESESLKAQKELAKITFKRYENLLKQSFVSQSEYDKVKMDLDTVDAQLEATMARIESSKIEVNRTKKNADSLKTKLSRFKIYAPVDGYVISKDAQVAQSVSSSASILKIVDPKTVWIRAYIDERISGDVKVGQKAEITLRSKDNKLFVGHVKRIVAQSDAITQEREINIAFDNLPIPFYINEQARVSVNVKTITNTLKVPLNTLKVRNEKEGVWVLKDNKAYFKALDIQAKSDTEAAIVGGLEKNDNVLIPNSSKKPLSEGMRIHQ